MRDFPDFLKRLPLLRGRPASAYALTLIFCAIAFAVRWGLDSAFPAGFPFLTFFPAVILSSFLFGVRAGTLAAIVCGLLAWYFFIPPKHAFALAPGTIVALSFYLGVVVVDILLIHWMQSANKSLEAERERNAQLAATRALLFQELQHRVSNNLQMAAAVLHLQRRGADDAHAQAAIADAAAKLALIGRIQRNLYRPDGEQLTLDEFLGQLSAEIIQSGGKPGVEISVQAVPGIVLEPNAAIPVALIMAEAMANALEHGFANRSSGQIDVRVQKDSNWVELSVADDGAGPPAGFKLETAESLGLKIVKALTAQLNGHVGMIRANGQTTLLLRFPMPALAAA